MFVKVCGLTTKEQIDWAVELGYTAIGIVGTPRSKRYCPPGAAVELARHCRNRIQSFIVAYRLDEIVDVAGEFDVVQLYEWANIPNLAISSDKQPGHDAAYSYFFYDASVGSGAFSEIPEWVTDVQGNVVLAGGLNEANVAAVIGRYSPYGVDVSSSVEDAPGIKNHESMKRFIQAVR